MAQNPFTVTCPNNSWVTVANNVLRGEVTILKPAAGYKLTYAVNPSTPPTSPQDANEIPKIQNLNFSIEADVGIDVYCFCTRGEDGLLFVALQ